MSESSETPRLLRFKERLAMQIESPAERAAHSMVDAVDDLSLAIWTAQTPEALAEIRTAIDETMGKLMTAQAVALSLEEHFGDRR